MYGAPYISSYVVPYLKTYEKLCVRPYVSTYSPVRKGDSRTLEATAEPRSHTERAADWGRRCTGDKLPLLLYGYTYDLSYAQSPYIQLGALWLQKHVLQTSYSRKDNRATYLLRLTRMLTHDLHRGWRRQLNHSARPVKCASAMLPAGL